MNFKPLSIGLCAIILLSSCQASSTQLFETANQHFANQAFEEAIPIYESLLIKDSGNVNIYPKLAISYAYAGNWERCTHYGKMAFDKGVDYFALYDSVVKCYDAQGQADQARSLYQEGLQKYPDRYEYKLEYGLFEFSQQNLPKAAEIFEHLSQINPQNEDFAYNAAATFEALEQLDKAETYYRQVLEHHPDHANASYGLGSLYDKRKQPDIAIGFFEKALKYHPQHLSALMNLARLQEAKTPQEALKTWQKYLALAEKNQQPEQFINQAKEHIQRLGGGAPVPDEKPPQDG